jgi:hypothetical protein
LQHVLTHGIQLKAERTSNIFLEMKRLKQTLISKVGEPKIEAHSTAIENPVISNLSELPACNQNNLCEEGQVELTSVHWQSRV